MLLINSFTPYSRREPEEPEDATKGRDVFNEKPPPEELLAVSDLGKAATTSLPDSLVWFLNHLCVVVVSPLLDGNLIYEILNCTWGLVSQVSIVLFWIT